MPRQKQSKPKALKQQREEVEQLIRDGGSSDTKKQDGPQSAKSTKHPDVSSAVEKAKRAKGKKRHRYKNATKVKIANKVRTKRLIKALLPRTEFPVSQDSTVKDRNLSPNSNNNETPLTEIKELSSPNLVAEVGSEPALDISDFKDKYDMIKERSLLRATKVKKTTQDKDKAKDVESSPKKGSESPKKIPVSPVKEPEIHLQRSPTKVEPAPVTLSPKPKLSYAQRKLSEREIGKLNNQDLISRTANIVKGRQRSVSEGIPTSQESKQQALEALLQITGVELHTMSKVPTTDQTPTTNVNRCKPQTDPHTNVRLTTVTTSSTHIAPQTSLSGVHKGGMVKISETDKGVVKYHLQSDSLEEQGLKLVYTAQSVSHATQEQLKYNAYNRSRKNSTKSNASDSAEDLTTAKDSQKCCKKPGRHVCQFCGRRCTKPSVLKKHIRSHTGERPYPCLPCGFSFKTKSNLYKHCKTHAHAIKAGLTPNTEDLSKLALAELDEDDSEETESEDEITTCDATTCQTELTEKCSHPDTHIHVGSIPHSEIESVMRISPESKTAKSSNIPMMQVTRSLAAVPNIPRQQADSQSNQKAISRHSSSWVPTLNSVLPTANIQRDMPLLSTLLPNQSSRSSDISSVGRSSSAPSASVVDIPKTNSSYQDRHQAAENRNDEEVVMSASGASSSQLLKSILPGELAGFRIDMETRRAIPVLNPQLGTPGSPSSNPSGEESSSNPGQLLIPLTGFNIVKSGGQYHVQIPVQGIPEDSLTMSLEGETCPAVEGSGSISNQTKGVSKESLQERIQLLISQNRAIVDDTVLESVKPRRTSASRRDSENNSPKIESSLDPAIDVRSSDGRSIQSSAYPEFVNPSLRYRRGSLSEAQSPSLVSHSPKGYVLPGESNLLERVLKSQQQSSLVGTPGADKHILVPMSDHQAVKMEALNQQAGNPSDNSNSIKDLLMQDRQHRLAQIAQQTPALISGESPAGQGSPRMNIIPGTPWPIPHGTDSAMSQLRGTLQQQRRFMQAPPNQMYPALYNATEDVNISQRISELRGAGRRRKYKSESDALGESMTSGPSSPKRRARKIKDIPSVVSPLATSSVRNQSATFTSSRTPTEHQKDAILKSGASPHGNFMSSPLPTASTHLTAAYSKLGYPARHTSLDTVTTMSQEPSIHGHLTSMQSHMASMQSRVTSVTNVMTALTSNVATMQGHTPLYPTPISSVPGFASSQTRQLTSPPVLQKPFPGQGTSAVSFHQSSIPATHVSSVYTQPLPSVSEVSVIQHTRMQGKSEPANKELKLEVSQAKELPPATYPWPYRFPAPVQSPGAGSPASQGLHLLAVASKSQDVSPQTQMANRKRSFSLTEGIPTAPKQEALLASPWPREDPILKAEKKKSTEEGENAAPIAMQLLAAVAHSSSYVPGVSPRVTDSSRPTVEPVVTPQSLPDLPRKSSPPGSLSVESPMQSPRAIPELKQHREIGSPELKKIKMERNSVSPKSPRSDARSPRSDANRQSPTSLPRIPASRRHLTLDLKSPLTSRVKSPGASEASKSLLQIDPKSLLTPEALSIAESVMKLASPMKANTPITPVESARELGRLMAHAYLNAGGRVENLITSTQGTMMIGPIATPTPGSGSGSTQYFIIPSPSSSQAPTGFPGPNTLFSPTASTASSLVSPLRSPLATSQPQTDQAVVTTNCAPHFKRVPPQKPDCQGIFEAHIMNHVKTNSALRHKIRCSKLSRSTARNSKITQVTFCCVKRPQPMYVQQGGNRKISMYSNWRPGGNCPHPLGISWKAHLALYDTGRNKKPKFYYVTTSISPPQGGVVTDSAGWRPETAPKTADSQPHSEGQGPHTEMMDTSAMKSMDAGCTLEKSALETDTFKAKEKKPKEASDQSLPSRIPIFSGGYKSNENYVYVRGRGRGKYVCEECGIRCKKPSMLKKHIRTHTDMRPYQCQICNFAFKTKGNLTKHMKSKAHSKKCTKNGISATDESCMEHQFSDADDEDTDSADGETSDEDEDEDEDDDISETHSESAVPVSGVVPHRERYSSVPNMPESVDAQGRPLVWHQYDQARMKRGNGETHDRPRRDSTGSISALDSSKSGGNSKEMAEDKQPVKLSRSEVVGKLSRHLTNRHQQSLEKAQKAGVSTPAKPGEIKGHDSSKLFDLSQLPPFHPGLLPQPTKLTNISLFPSSKVDGLPPKPPLLDKYGHIVLTTSNSSTSQYRLSTTVQENPHSQNKLRPSNGNIESRVTPQASVPPLASLEKQLARKPQPNVEFLTAGSPFLHSKLGSTLSASPVTTSGTSSPKEHVPNLVQAPSSLSSLGVLHTDTKATSSSGYPSHHEPTPVSSVSIPPGAANLVVGVNTMHAIPSRDMHLFPSYPVSGESRAAMGAQQVPYQGSFGVSPHLQRMMSPPFLSAYQDSSRPVASSLNASRANPVVSPSSQIKPQLSPRVHASPAASSYAAGETGKSIPPPICVEAISDEEDQNSPRKRQKLNPQEHSIMVSGSINNPSVNSPSSVPSWMSKPGSAIKQLLLAKPSVLPVSHESPKPSFFSPFLPPSLVSPKLVKSSVAVSVTSSLQPPLVSPMVPSKMMQLPPTILSQVRSPTVQSSGFSLRDEHRDSPIPFVPPVARSKTQFQWTFPQSHSIADRQQASGDQIPLEVSEELVSSPTHLGNHKCSSCNKVFMKPSQLRIHMRIHLEENSFLCPECVLSFPTRILLAKHERSEEHLSKVDAVELPSASGESDPRPFKCKECQIAFRIPGHLAKHLRSRGHRMTLEREGKLPIPKEELLCQEMSDMEQGDLVIDDSHQPSSPAGSSDKTDSASEAGDMDAAEAISTI